MPKTWRRGLAAAPIIMLAAALTACDDGERADTRRGRQQAEIPDVKPGGRPEAKPGLVGTWRVRLEAGAKEAEGPIYTFTADGRVTVGPGQTCRYRVEDQVLAVDCAGASAESAKGPLERQDQNNLVWRVGEKSVRLERQAGIKEQ